MWENNICQRHPLEQNVWIIFLWWSVLVHYSLFNAWVNRERATGVDSHTSTSHAYHKLVAKKNEPRTFKIITSGHQVLSNYYIRRYLKVHYTGKHTTSTAVGTCISGLTTEFNSLLFLPSIYFEEQVRGECPEAGSLTRSQTSTAKGAEMRWGLRKPRKLRVSEAEMER